eukprot:4107795-Amphidinium_carterae.1
METVSIVIVSIVGTSFTALSVAVRLETHSPGFGDVHSTCFQTSFTQCHNRIAPKARFWGLNGCGVSVIMLVHCVYSLRMSRISQLLRMLRNSNSIVPTNPSFWTKQAPITQAAKRIAQ